MWHRTCTVVLMACVSLAAAVPTYYQTPSNYDSPSQTEADVRAFNCIYYFSTREDGAYIGPGSLLECLQQLEEATGHVPRIKEEHVEIVQNMVDHDYRDCVKKQRFPSRRQCREETTRGEFKPQVGFWAALEAPRKPTFLLQSIPGAVKAAGQRMSRYFGVGSDASSPGPGSAARSFGQRHYTASSRRFIAPR